MTTLGIIPARGNSKGVPRKNCRLLHGCPLIGYTVRAAQAASLLTDFVVSTEDEEIKNIALSYGAAVVDRPESLAADDTTSGAVCRHALDVMEDRGKQYDIIVCLHPTSPIRDPKHIDQAIMSLAASKADSLASICALPKKSHPNIVTGDFDEPIWRLGGRAWIMNAAIYAMKRDWFLKNNRHVGGQSIYLEMDRRHSIDIDTEEDFKIAELFLNG